MLAFMAFRRWRLALLLAPFLAPPLVAAQFLQGGQFFTSGLAIISSPQADSQFSAGSDISIAISLSGQGKIQDLNPGGGTDGSGYDDLQLYLVSAPINLNVTVATDLLQIELDQNVKHPKFTVPACIPQGNYNLTLYERSRFKNVPLFVISQLPLQITNPNPSGVACIAAAQANTIQAQPQVDSPLDGSPWLFGEIGRQVGTSRATLVNKNAPPQGLLVDNNSPSRVVPAGSIAAANNFAAVSQVEVVQEVTTTAPPNAQATQRSGPNRSTFSIRTITITADLEAATLTPFNVANGAQGILFPVNSGALDSRLIRRGAWMLPAAVLLFSLL